MAERKSFSLLFCHTTYWVLDKKTLSVEQRRSSLRNSVNNYILPHVRVGVGNGIVILSYMLVKGMHGTV